MPPSIKPNHFPPPGPIGNTQGIIVPKTEADAALKPKEESWWDKWGGVVHTGLDIIGMIPVVGEIADGANAVIYAAEGDYTNAALSAAAMLPVGGQAATAAKLANRAVKAGKKVAQKAAPKAARAGAKAAAKKQGGRVKGKKKKKDKPSSCCPKNQGAGKKPTTLPKPSHIGTGEEILEQTDFVIEGPIPFDWTRTYRSGSECEDWGLLGARWATPYTASLSVCAAGIVVHEPTGRGLRLPALAPDGEYDHRGEGFVLRQQSSGYLLTWRDGSYDEFQRGADAWLPHGYDGVNAMLDPEPPLRVQRYHLVRSTDRDGKAIHVQRRDDAKPGEWVLKIRCDDGPTLECLRAAILAPEPDPNVPEAPRIGQIDQILPDGSRVCHVRYRYDHDPLTPPAHPSSASRRKPRRVPTFADLPQRYTLVEQTNALGNHRRYAYKFHLLVNYENYNGFTQGLKWISLSFLRAKWEQSPLSDAELLTRHRIALNDS